MLFKSISLIFSLKTDPESKTEAFDLLLKHDGDFSTADEAGKSVLDKAIDDYLASSHSGRNNTPRDFLLCVLNSGKHIRRCDDILLHAAEMGDFRIAKYMILEGADCTVKDKVGHNVLHLWITGKKGNKVCYLTQIVTL